MQKNVAAHGPSANEACYSYQFQYQEQPQQQQQMPPPNMPPSYEQATHATAPHAHVLQAPLVIIQHQTAPPVGPEPAFLTCPYCQVQKLTRVEYEPSSRTHLMAALLCILGLWCFACLPYCAGSCMNANHYCGNCNKYVGVYNHN